MPCKGLVGAIFQDADDIAQSIIDNLKAQGAASTTLSDSELKKILAEEIEAQIEELSVVLPDVKSIMSDYFVMALI